MIQSFLVFLLCLAASTPDASIEEKLLHQASSAGRGAVEAAQISTDEARALWETAAIRYEETVQGYENGQIYYNLGNTYAQLDDIPHAILNYRRAQYFLPHNRQLLANLQYVRAKRQDHIAEPETSPVLQTLCFWHYDLSFHARLWLATLLNAIFWATAIRLL
ncbi:MAG: tetratricopeptide repeat protein [Victivallales bacterium]|nr:tetratricopeptide repeat protein [Victivallales bacterium]